MRREDFTLALSALLPDCGRELVCSWSDFASECLAKGQYAYFTTMEAPYALRSWMDAIYAGLYAVSQKYGTEIATKLAGLGRENCCLYPGEMMQAAEVLQNGGGAAQILSMIHSDKLVAEEPFFFDLPEGGALIRLAPEIEIMRTGVLCGFDQKEVKPGYVLTDGTILLESKRDSFGRYKGGTGVDGIYHPTGRIYAPVPSWKGGEAKAFQLVKPVTDQDRETEFLASRTDVLAVYRLKSDPAPDGHMPLTRLQESGESPLAGNYGLIRVAELIPGSDPYKVMEAYRTADTIKPGDVAAFKQAGMVRCWYVDQLSYSKLSGLLKNHLKAVEMGEYDQFIEAINYEAPRFSVRDSLRQFRDEAEKSKSNSASPDPNRNPER